jgi:hypothetical protein
MHIARTSLALIAGMIMVVLFVPTASAGISSQSTEISFSQPVRIPGGKVLPAGTYWLTLVDHGNTHRLVVIYNAKRNRPEALLQTMPAFRMTASNRTEITLAERGRNEPDVLVNRFYPGMHYGHSFIYSLGTDRRLSEEPVVKVFAKTRQMVS